MRVGGFILAILSTIACVEGTGIAGPEGAQGPPGEMGPPGQAGSVDPSNLRGRWSGQFLVSPTQWSVADGGNNHWYGVLATQSLTWAQAKAEAEALGGHLVSLSSDAENSFVEELILTVPDEAFVLSPAGFHIGPWVGGIQRPGSEEPGQGFGWLTGEAFTYEGWLPGQPNNSSDLENAILFMGNPLISDGLGWSDYPDAPDNITWQVIPSAAVIELEP